MPKDYFAEEIEGKSLTPKRDYFAEEIGNSIPYSKEQLSGKMIPQLTKGLYEKLPFGKRIVSLLPNADKIKAVQEGTPAPRGLLPMAARFTGEVAPDAIMMSPGINAAGMIPKLSGIQKLATGIGGYEGVKKVVQGKPKEAIPTAAAAGLTTLALGYGGRFAVKQLGKGVEAIANRNNPEVLMQKAQKLTTEVLQPSKTDLQKSLQRGETLPAVKEATRVIKASKNYTDLRNNLDTVIKESFNRRNSLMTNNNYKVGGEYIDDLRTLIADTEAMGQATPQEINTMKDVLMREEQFLKSRPNFDRLTAQDRKEKLQDLTHSLLQKMENGEIIDREPARNLALNALRQGLRKAVNGNDAEISRINASYEGLKDAKWLVSGQEALAKKAVPQGILQKLSRFITRPQDIPGDVARGVLEKQQSLYSKTKTIEKLGKKVKP